MKRFAVYEAGKKINPPKNRIVAGIMSSNYLFDDHQLILSMLASHGQLWEVSERADLLGF